MKLLAAAGAGTLALIVLVVALQSAGFGTIWKRKKRTSSSHDRGLYVGQGLS